MNTRHKITRIALVSIVGVVGIWLGAEGMSGAYSDLCTSVPGSCDYGPPYSPVLQEDVCWDGTTVTLKGVGDCTGEARPYYLEYGEVDPSSGHVQGYIALSDACDQGYCDVLPPGTPPGSLEEICCRTDWDTHTVTCYTDLMYCAGGSGEILWCDDLHDNQDGTVTCNDDSE